MCIVCLNMFISAACVVSSAFISAVLCPRVLKLLNQVVIVNENRFSIDLPVKINHLCEICINHFNIFEIVIVKTVAFARLNMFSLPN